MQPDRIAELLAPFLPRDERLTTGDLNHISTYIDLLLRWNARINLTAIRDPEQIVTRHFGESLFAARHLFPRETYAGTAGSSPTNDPAQKKRKIPTVADVGSGAGFPGFPIKLWDPDITLTLIESNHKKAAFLREVARALTLTDVNIQIARAETLPAASFDVVTLRAVESFEAILPVAANLAALGGRLALLIGSAQLGKAQSSLPQFTWSEPAPMPDSNSRILAIANRAD